MAKRKSFIGLRRNANSFNSHNSLFQFSIQSDMLFGHIQTLHQMLKNLYIFHILQKYPLLICISVFYNHRQKIYLT